MKVRATQDPSYLRWRESKIPEAAARADAAYPQPLDGDLTAWRWHWDAAFLRFMDQLIGDPMSDSRVN